MIFRIFPLVWSYVNDSAWLLTSISDRVTIIDTDIEHSVILSDTKITGIHQRIVDSVIGQRVSMKVSPKRPQALRFLVGDDSQLEIM